MSAWDRFIDRLLITVAIALPLIAMGVVFVDFDAHPPDEPPIHERTAKPSDSRGLGG